tara:strand:+ start:800 stop:1258 length:459 start_codon:yes stop_codon:yes gene_type:complete
MIFSRFLFIILFLISTLSLAIADDNATTEEIVDQAKEINKQIEEEEEDVPLNDPFAGNEGTSSSSNANVSQEELQDQFSLYNYKLSGLISGKDHSYISLVDASGDSITLTLGQNLGKVKLVDLRLTEAIFEKEDKTYLIIDFNNMVRESDEY